MMLYTGRYLSALPPFGGAAAVDDGERLSGVEALQVLQCLLVVVVHGAVLSVAVVGPPFAVVDANIDVEVLETLGEEIFDKPRQVFVFRQYGYGYGDVSVPHCLTTLAELVPQRRM